MTFNNEITLTIAATGDTFDVGAANLVLVFANGNGSTVYYTTNGATLQMQVVTESPSTISTDSENLISVTNVNNGLSYINPNRILTMQEFFTPLTGPASETTDTITAHAGGGQGSAVALTTQYNIVTVCATTGDSVKLEAAAAGLIQIVYNNTAHTLAVFPASGDTINSGSANASVNVLAGTQAIFTAGDSTNWVKTYPIQSKIIYDNLGAANLSLDIQESIAALETAIAALVTQVVLADMTYTNATGISAAGTTQGTATQLDAVEYNNVTTVTSGTGVLLVAASAGLSQVVKNNGANALVVYPATGDTIDGASVNAGITLQVGDQLRFWAINSTDWESNKVYTDIISTNIIFDKEVDHTISVATTTTAATVGGALAVTAGAGATSGIGGALAIAGGAGGTTGAGGAVTITSGAATNVTSGTGAASGAVTITAGASATATTGTGGAGALVKMIGAAGGVATGAAGIGGAGSAVQVTSGAGGAASSATGGVPGVAGTVTVSSGAGGAAAGTGVAGGASANISITGGAGGASTHAAGGAGGAGAAIAITSGNGGAVTNAAVAGGVGGAVTITGGNSGAGSTAGAAGGAVTITGGNGVGTAGAAGNVILTPGTTSVTTVAPVVISTTAIIQKNTAAPFFLIGTTASDGAFAKAIVGGYVEIRGATGNVQMPTASQLVTAIGAVTAGTRFQFVLNAIGGTPMTAGNTATVTTNTGVVIDASVGNTLMTVTSTSNVNIGVFQVTFDSATTCILSRM